MIKPLAPPGGGGGRGLPGLVFAGYVLLACHSPYPITVYSVANDRPHLMQSLLGKYVIFAIPTFTFYLCIHLILNEEHSTFQLQYKHSDTFANRKYEEPSYPKNQKMCDPFLVTVLKMRPHYSQSRRENATTTSGTSPLGPYKEVPPG